MLTLIKTPAKEDAGTRESRSAKNIQRDFRSKLMNVLLQLIGPRASSTQCRANHRDCGSLHRFQSCDVNRQLKTGKNK
jgi:hypothetical protein